jgi:hypothetical protein
MLLPRFIAAVEGDGLTRRPGNHHPAARRNGVVDTEKRRLRRNDFSIGLGARVVFLFWRLRLPPGRRIRARRWLSRPWDAIDLVRLTVDVGCAAICWRGRAVAARSFLGVELAGHVVAGASAPAARCVMTARLYPVAPHMRPRRSHRRRCR